MKNLVIILLFIFASCSTKKDTEANFQVSLRNMVGNNNDASLFPGGLILYGVSGQLSFSRIMDSTIKDELVPNGIWDFYVLGWDGKAPDRKPMTGKVYCGVAKGVNLNGTATKVELTATNAKCADSIFGNHVTDGTEIKFPNINLISCNDLGHIAPGSSTTDCSYNSDPSVYKNTKGTARSYKILATGFNRDGLFYDEISNTIYESSCVAVDTNASGGLASGEVLGFGGSGNLDGLNIPPGSDGTRFSFKLRAYFGSDNCIDAYAYKDIPLVKGASTNKTFFDEISSNNMFVKTTTQDVCELGTSSIALSVPQPFKGGAGEAGMPFILCSGDDINEISNTHADRHFLVGRDIDMHLSDPNKVLCRVDGANTNPIGGLSNFECSEGSGIDPFSGTFDGNKKIIKNMKLVHSEIDQMGFIRSTMSGARFINSIFENAHIEGNRKVGLIGEVNGGSFIEDLHLVNSFVKGYDSGAEADLGAIIGRYAAVVTGIKKLNAKNVTVKNVSGGDHIGGIIGFNPTSDSIREAFFNGKIILSHNKESIGVGGIVGKSAHAAAQVYHAASKGIIFGHGKDFGGIAGYLKGSLNNSYSEMAIVNTRDSISLNLGGLVGKFEGTSVSKSFYAGKLYFEEPGCTTCKQVLGYGSPSFTSVLVSDEVSAQPQATNVSDAALNTLSGTPWNAFPWQLEAGRYPFLSGEEDLCHGDALKPIADQININNYGKSEDRPAIICNRDQFMEIDGIAGHFFELGKSINLGDGQGGLDLKSKLNGNNHSIIINDIGTDATFAGIFNKISLSATIENLNVFGMADKGEAVLAGTNNGLINNVHVFGVRNGASATENGIMVGVNQGLISKSSVYGRSDIFFNFGAVAGVNKNQITKTKSLVSLNDTTSSSVSNLGGLVGHNDAAGLILESKALSLIDIGASSGAFSVGGLVGVNDGVVSNTYVELGSEIALPSSLGDIGGLVGINNGQVKNSYSMNKMFTYSFVPSSVGGIIGSTGGSSSEIDSYYALEPLLYLASDSGLTGSCTLLTCNIWSYSDPGFDGTHDGNIFLHESMSGEVDYLRVTTGTGATTSLNLNFDYTIPSFGGELTAFSPLAANGIGHHILTPFNDLENSPGLNNLLTNGDSWAEGSVYPFTPKLLHVDD